MGSSGRDGEKEDTKTDGASDGKEGDTEDEGEQECGNDEARGAPRTMRAPEQPTRKEREEHEATHTPYRSWCRYCVAGSGKSGHHRRRTDAEKEEDAVPVIAMDYFFLGNKRKVFGASKDDDERSKEAEAKNEGNAMMPVLMVKDVNKTKMATAYAVPSKGMSTSWIASRVAEDIAAWGYGKIVLKSDQEPSMLEVVDETAKRLRRELLEATSIAIKEKRVPVTILESSPVGESASNGAIEVAIQHLEGKIRTLKMYLEERIGYKIKVRSPIMAWLIRHASDTYNKHQVGSDGRTAYERLKGKRCRQYAVPFAETVMYLPLKPARQSDKAEPRWRQGLFLGYVPRTGERLIGDGRVVVRAYSIKRLTKEEAWQAHRVRELEGTPWKPHPDLVTEQIPVHAEEDEAAGEKKETRKEIPIDEQQEERAPPRMYIKRADIERYGMTPGCRGCRDISTGKERVAHSDECRKRIREEMEKVPSGRARLERVEQKRARFDEKVADYLEQEMNKRKAGAEEMEARVDDTAANSSNRSRSSSSSSGNGGKRANRTEEEDVGEGEAKRRKVDAEREEQQSDEAEEVQD